MFAKERKNGIIQIVVMAVLLTAVLLQSNATVVAAKENNVVPELDSGRSGSLTVCYQSNEDGNVIPLKNAEFRICRVSDLTVKNNSAKYTLVPEFASAGISFEGMTAADSGLAAKKLYDLTKSNGTNMRTGKTDANGCVKFSNLQPGMYLVVQPEKLRQGNNDYVSSPFLVSVPLAVDGENGNNVWQYEVKAYPKHSSSKPVDKPLIPNPPDTGDLLFIGFWGCVLIICAVGLKVVFIGKNKRIQL